MDTTDTHEEINTIIQNLFESQVYAHYNHLNTRSYAIHKALGNYYEGIAGHIDELGELYMGEQPPSFLLTIPDSIQIPMNFSETMPHKYFDELGDTLDEILENGDFSEVFSDRLRATIAFIRTTVYLLSRLK